jgi:hypothetical protein
LQLTKWHYRLATKGLAPSRKLLLLVADAHAGHTHQIIAQCRSKPAHNPRSLPYTCSVVTHRVRQFGYDSVIEVIKGMGFIRKARSSVSRGLTLKRAKKN